MKGEEISSSMFQNPEVVVKEMPMACVSLHTCLNRRSDQSTRGSNEAFNVSLMPCSDSQKSLVFNVKNNSFKYFEYMQEYLNVIVYLSELETETVIRREHLHLNTMHATMMLKLWK